jgi:methylenetetrahydrofolate dehydrogenase (NADP+)/methenyltetrahydrofolate cyclohydrolase
MILLNGKEVATNIKQRLAEETIKLIEAPGLAVILVGSNPASEVYVRNKENTCTELGFYSRVFRLPEDTSEEELISTITKLNINPTIHGILVQLPLPKHLNEERIINTIAPEKDVDCFHPVNVGKLMTGIARTLPCTPAGVMKILEYYNIQVEGKNCVVVGRSNIVGKPMAMLLLQANGTVTICHSKTKNLKEICREADILVAAIGKPKFITEEYIKEGAVIVDVGINRDENGKLCGDVDFEAVKDKVYAITPVPGGCGPMTIAMLMQNTYDAFMEAKI